MAKQQLTEREEGICSKFGTLVAKMESNPGDIPKVEQFVTKHFVLLKPRKTYKKYQHVIKKHQYALEQLAVPWQVQLARKYNHLYLSAMERGKEFNLTLGDVNLLLKAPTCFYTAVELTAVPGQYQRTIDRVDPNKGYVKGNVVACSHLANQIKDRLFESPSSDLRTNIEFMDKLISKLQTTK